MRKKEGRNQSNGDDREAAALRRFYRVIVLERAQNVLISRRTGARTAARKSGERERERQNRRSQSRGP